MLRTCTSITSPMNRVWSPATGVETRWQSSEARASRSKGVPVRPISSANGLRLGSGPLLVMSDEHQVRSPLQHALQQPLALEDNLLHCSPGSPYASVTEACPPQ